MNSAEGFSSKVKLVVQTAEIPSVPKVLQDIIALADNPNATGSDLEKLVMQEPGLVTHLLKIVNSAYYSLPSKISSVQQAIVMLGFTSVKSTAMGLMLVDSFNSMGGIEKKYVKQVFKHGLVAANLMKFISEKEDREKRDLLFLAAMVQNVGHLILAQYYGEKYKALAKNSPFLKVELENDQFELSHAEVGAALLSDWKFPASVINLVHHHHSRDLYKGSKVEIDYLRLSDLMALDYSRIQAQLSVDESNADPALLSAVKLADLSWEKIQMHADKAGQAVELVNQIL